MIFNARNPPVLLLLLGSLVPLHAQSELDSALQKAIEDGVIIGAQAYAGRGDAVLLDAVYGRVRPDHATGVNPETLFCIGSVSKPLVSTIALGLANDGQVRLEAPVSRYLPTYGALPEPPTLAQLLAHRGGVYTQRRRMSASQVRWIRDFRLTLAEAVDGIAKEEPIAKPGELYAYSGAGYCVLGRALELAAGSTLETLLQRRIGSPLGWERTSYFPAPKDPNVAAGAGESGEPHPETPHLLGEEYRLALAGGSVYSTARELARFAQAMAAGGGKILPREAFLGLLHPPFPGPLYGYGWSLKVSDGLGVVYGLRHTGSLAASRASIRVDLSTGRYAVVLYSVGTAPTEAVKLVNTALDGYL